MQTQGELPKAIPFIIYRKPEGFIITDEARQFFDNFPEQKIGIISIVGKYRTGKSYLINKVILNNPSTTSYLRDSRADTARGFQVGSTVNACTKGIWIWTKAIPSENPDEEDTLVVVMDTEGFGAVTEGHNHDSRVILFSMLLSSMFVYNSMGTIDENALQTLGLVVNMAKNIQLESTGSEELDEDTIAETFPLFLWVVRDFALKLVDENNFKISSGLYFEKALEKLKGHSTKTESKNKVRRLIKHFFRKRDCITMIRPVENESDLKQLETLPDYRLRKEFLQQIQRTRSIVFRRVTAKKINGRFVDGPRLIALAEAYIDSVNNGRAPCIENAWEFVRKFENKKTTEKTIGMIRSAMSVKTEGALGITLNLADMFEQNPELRQPRRSDKEVKEWSGEVLGKIEDYERLKPFLVEVYKKNLLGEEVDNQDLIQEFTAKLDQKMGVVFKSLEGQVEKTLEHELRQKVDRETSEMLENDCLKLEDCMNKYGRIWSDIESRYGQYFSEGSGLREKVEGLFEREKARTYGKLLKAVQDRKELEDERRNKDEQVRLFREGEAKRRVQEEMEEYKASLAEIRRKNAERVVAFKEKEKEHRETQERVKDLEDDNSRLQEKCRDARAQAEDLRQQNEELERQLQEERAKLGEEQKARLREQAMSSQKDVLMHNKADELKAEIEQLKSELKIEKRKIKENEKKLQQIKEEQAREDRVVVDTEQLKVLQDKLQEYVERLGSAEQEKEALCADLKESETQNELLRGRLEIMENNFREIEHGNQKFLGEISRRIEKIQEAQPEKISQNLVLNIQKFALWKKILKICNLFQCGKCSRFIPKKMILVHINSCLSRKELQALGLFESISNSLKDLGIDSSEHPQQPSLVSKCQLGVSDLSIKMVQSLVREQVVEGESRPYTEYVFKVYSGSLDTEWHVSRKFKEFCQLLVDLQNKNPDIDLPESCFELWSYVNDIWGLIGNSVVNLDKRLDLLQTMMNDLIKSERVVEVALFQEFICFGESKDGIWG